MVIMFRLAKMLIKNGNRVQIRHPKGLEGRLIHVDGIHEGHFVTEICEQRVVPGGGHWLTKFSSFR
jgi:hypothetical protein